MKTKFIKYLAFLPLLASCDDLFDPALENIQDIDYMHNDPSYAQGILGNAYILLPYQNGPASDYATDDAVTNDNTSGYTKMAMGAWASNMDPVSQWDGRYHAIQYINTFLEHTDRVKWANSPVLRRMYNDHFKGEAYGLRALNLYHLLRAHAGIADDGVLYGVPIHTQSEGANTDFNQPRDKFQDCIDQIMADLDSAMYYLPMDCGNITDDQVPAKYTAIGGSAIDYNRAFGDHEKGVKLTGRVVEGIRAQVALFAASPAYASGSNATYADAADAAAAVIDHNNGLAGLDPDGWWWYANTEVIDNLKAGDNPKEVLWRSGGMDVSHSLESTNFPNSLYGEGRTNPSQNLVDAFPMANGFPITDADSEYDPQDPYAGRDPRLATYILLNGSTLGVNNATITTGSYSSNLDGINKEQGKSTRTGYYMRKLLRTDVNLDPNSTTDKNHIQALIRYTEIYLDYAEAANEAWGPVGKGTHAYSAYDVIKAIRERAGVGVDDDPYLESMRSNKEGMRQLIRNERRLELCFENHRFWDLRRWNVDKAALNQTVKGMDITQTGSGLVYTVVPSVETRDYKDFMIYGPIPYSETLKYSNLQQNKGW